MKMRHSPRRPPRLWTLVAAIVLTLEVPSMCEAGESATRAAPAAVAPLRIGSHRELFTDRFLIEDMKGTDLRLHLLLRRSSDRRERLHPCQRPRRRLTPLRRLPQPQPRLRQLPPSTPT